MQRVRAHYTTLDYAPPSCLLFMVTISKLYNHIKSYLIRLDDFPGHPAFSLIVSFCADYGSLVGHQFQGLAGEAGGQDYKSSISYSDSLCPVFTIIIRTIIDEHAFYYFIIIQWTS